MAKRKPWTKCVVKFVEDGGKFPAAVKYKGRRSVNKLPFPSGTHFTKKIKMKARRTLCK